MKSTYRTLIYLVIFLVFTLATVELASQHLQLAASSYTMSPAKPASLATQATKSIAQGKKDYPLQFLAGILLSTLCMLKLIFIVFAKSAEFD